LHRQIDGGRRAAERFGVSPATGSVLLLLDGYRDGAGSRQARAAIVSDERLKGQNASRRTGEERAFAASAVFAFGHQIGKEARRFTGVAGLDIGIASASKQGHGATLEVADLPRLRRP